MGKELDQIAFFAKSAGLLAALGTALRAKALLMLYVLAYVLARRRKTAVAKELNQFTFFTEEGRFSRAESKALTGALLRSLCSTVSRIRGARTVEHGYPIKPRET